MSSENDIVLRCLPYEWKKEYDKEVKYLLKDIVDYSIIPNEYFPSEENKNNLRSTKQISRKHAEIINKSGQFYIKDTRSSNGTFLDGKRIKTYEDYPLKDDMRINIAKVLDLQSYFFGELKKKGRDSDTLSTCYTVLGETSDSCFGIDKKGVIDAIKFKRRNNYTDREEYIILVREVTIGRSRSNGIIIEDNKVSDIHARIFYRDNQYWIEDLNSRHGTSVNGKQLTQGAKYPLAGRQR